MDDRSKGPLPSPVDELAEVEKQRVEEPSGRGWIWVVYLLLFAASIPWYLPQDQHPRIWFGFPHWVVISLLATAGIALFTAFVIHRSWRDRELTTNPTDEEGRSS